MKLPAVELAGTCAFLALILLVVLIIFGTPSLLGCSQVPGNLLMPLEFYARNAYRPSKKE